MNYIDYFNIASSDEDINVFSNALIKYEIKVLRRELKANSIPDSTWSNFLYQLSNFEINSFRNAKFKSEIAIKGIVIYHSGAGSTFEDNALLCQQLASNGFLVIGSAYQRGDGKSLNVDSNEDSFADIEFLLRYVKKQWKIKDYPIFLIGHSLGAQTIFKYIAQASTLTINKVVFLDTTQDYHGIAFGPWKFVTSVIQNIEKFEMSSLSVASPNALFHLQDELTRSSRTLLTIDSLGHNDFISQGIVHKMLMDHPKKEAYLKRYKFLNDYILHFLNSNNQQIFNPYGTLEKVDKGFKNNLDYNLSDSRPPTLRELLFLSNNEPIFTIVDLLEKAREFNQNDILLSIPSGFALTYYLLAKERFSDAKVVYKYYNDLDHGSLQRTFDFYVKFSPNYNGWIDRAKDLWKNVE